jgi:hypothetical protein
MNTTKPIFIAGIVKSPSELKKAMALRQAVFCGRTAH